MGTRLFDTVARYSALGEHRSGTAVDRETVDWVQSELNAIGASTTRHPYAFARYEASWEVRVDGRAVESLPLFYEGEGSVRTDDPVRTTQRVVGGSFLPDFEAVAIDALAEGRAAAVVATKALGGPLQAPNRHPRIGSGLPTVCVPERLGPALAEAKVEVELDARIVAGESANVVGTIGDAPDERRVVLSTPLSGWFACAGERGTGIAVMLEVARALASDRVPLTLLVTNGHELMGEGARRHLDEHGVRGCGVFHFGASVASGQPDDSGRLTRHTRGLRLAGWLGGDDGGRSALDDAFAPMDVPVHVPTGEQRRDPAWWRGESRTWSALGLPMVSMAGGFYLHHAPEDVPGNATTPDLLKTSFDAALAAARALARAGGAI